MSENIPKELVELKNTLEIHRLSNVEFVRGIVLKMLEALQALIIDRHNSRWLDTEQAIMTAYFGTKHCPASLIVDLTELLLRMPDKPETVHEATVSHPDIALIRRYLEKTAAL